MSERRATEKEIRDGADSGKSCAMGGCGGPGLCPGIALFIAYAVGAGLTFLTGLVWLGWLVGVPLAIVLITGAWKLIPSNRN